MSDIKVKILLAAIEVGSYTEAAQKLNLTQLTVSHQIRTLENEFSTKIFYRDKNKLKPTPQGKILVQHARRTAAVHNNARQAIEDSKTEISHLNVGTTPTAGGAIVPQILATFYNENPGIHINIDVNTIQRTYTRLEAYKFDFAAVEGIVSDNVLVTTTLDMDYLCLAVSSIHWLVKAKAISLRGTRHEKLILRSQSAGTRQLFEKHPGTRDMGLSEFSVMMEPDNVSMIKGLVSMDLGITIIAESACHGELASGRLATISIENSTMMCQIDMVYQENFIHSELIDSIRLIHEYLKAR